MIVNMPLCHRVTHPNEVSSFFSNFDPAELHIFLTGDETWEIFSRLLRGNNTLRSLSVDGAPIGDRAGVVFASALAENKSLTYLDVTSPALTDRAGEAIARSIAMNTMLVSINVRADTMSDRTGGAFAEAISLNGTVASLSLFGGSRMSDATGLRLAESLKTNRALKFLNLYGGSVGDATIDAFAVALEFNATLTSFIMRGSTPRSTQPSIARNRALPSHWRHLSLIVKYGQIGTLRVVIAAMTEWGFRRAVFEFFLPPEFVRMSQISHFGGGGSAIQAGKGLANP